jgi:hypothetical protein
MKGIDLSHSMLPAGRLSSTEITLESARSSLTLASEPRAVTILPRRLWITRSVTRLGSHEVSSTRMMNGLVRAVSGSDSATELRALAGLAAKTEAR